MIAPAPSRFLTPPAIANRLAVTPETVLGWIRSGELKAVNVAQRSCRRPRFRVDPIDLEIFLQGRQAVSTPKTPAPRRQRNPDVIQFFGSTGSRMRRGLK